MKFSNPEHSSDKLFSCSQCDQSFANLGELNKHEAEHKSDKPYSCSQCDKKFKNPCELNQHEAEHQSDKPFSCKKCGKNFVKNEVLGREFMKQLKLYKKHKNFVNNLIKKDIRKALGRNIDSNSSPAEIWRAIADVLLSLIHI